MCSGVRITTHLKAYRTHPKYMILAGERIKNLHKISIPDAQSNDIYECLVTLNLLLKILDELLSKKIIDFTKKQEYFEKIRNLQTELRKIQNDLPIDAPVLNTLIGDVKKLEYELVTLLKQTPIFNRPNNWKYNFYKLDLDVYCAACNMKMETLSIKDYLLVYK
jgi:hypothetical protein